MWAAPRVGWAAVPVCVCLPVCRALPGAVLMLIMCCMCCVCWNSVLRKLCWELLMQCLVCTVAGAGRVLRVRGAHHVWLRARWLWAASRGMARSGRSEPSGTHPRRQHGDATLIQKKKEEPTSVIISPTDFTQ